MVVGSVPTGRDGQPQVQRVTLPRLCTMAAALHCSSRAVADGDAARAGLPVSSALTVLEKEAAPATVLPCSQQALWIRVHQRYGSISVLALDRI